MINETPKLIDLLHGVTPNGWISVFTKQPPRTGVYKTIRQVGIARPEIAVNDKNRFVKKNGVQMWQTGPEITVLAWKKG